MDAPRDGHCVFERLMGLAADDVEGLGECILAVLRNAGSCSTLVSCPRRLGCSWLAFQVASRLSVAALAAAEHDRVLAHGEDEALAFAG